MKKHFKLISTLMCLIVCFALISFGVYSIANATSYKALQSSVSFTPTTARLKIFGGIYGDVDFDSENQPETSRYYACNYNTQASAGNYSEVNDKYVFNGWQYGSLTFADNDDGTADPIYFYIQITNYSETLIDYSVNFGNCISASQVDYNVYYYRASNYVGSLATNTNLTTNASANGFWSIEQTSKAVPNFTKKQETAMTDVSIEVDSTTLNPVKASIPNTDSMFSTTMIVIKLNVKDPNKNIDSSTFEFGVGAETVQQ